MSFFAGWIFMNAPIRVAQAGTTQAANQKVTVITLEKPAGGQAITVKTGFEGKVKLDFSKIADDRITIVRVGETAVIFFHDNKSTITLDPFFGSDNLPLAFLEFDLGGNRIFTPEQIAAILPFSIYQGILPAAGEAGGDPQNAGADFDPAVFEALPPILLNELLPPEELPGIDFQADLSPFAADPLVITGTIFGLVEEEQFNGQEQQPTDAGIGNEDVNDLNGFDTDEFPPDFLNTITLHVTGQLAPLVSGGTPPYAYAFIDPTADGDPENNFVHDTDSNLAVDRIKSQGDDVHFEFVDSTQIRGIASDGRIVFIVTLDNATGQLDFLLNDQIDHPLASFDDGTIPQGILEELLALNLSSVIEISDAGGQSVNLGDLPGPIVAIGVIDDTPIRSENKDIRTINEDDIETGNGNPTGSYGTSPQDGDFDGSFTNIPGEGTPGPATIFGSLTNTVLVGADKHPVSEGNTTGVEFEFITDDPSLLQALNDLHIQSKDVDIVFSFDGTGLVGYAGERLVMRLVLEIDGDYRFELHDQVDHDAPYDDFFDFPQLPGDTLNPPADQNHDLQETVDGDVVFINFGSLIKASDYDDDAITLDGKLDIAITDDIPLVKKCDPIVLKVDEDDISTLGSAPNPGSLGTSPDDDDSDGSYTGAPGVDLGGPAFVSGTLLGAVVESGADEGLTFSFISEGALRDRLEDLGLKSQGGPLNYDLSADGMTLYAFVNKDNPNGVIYDASDDRLVFTFEITDTATGAFEFKLYDQLDHDAPGDDWYDAPTNSDQNFDLQDDEPGDVFYIDFGGLLNATDFDGDTVNLDDTLLIKIRDDVPTLKSGSLCLTVDEDDISTINYTQPYDINPGSLGTSPNDSNGDGSFTGNPANNEAGPAYVSGTLGAFVASGADEKLTFSFISEDDLRDQLEALNLTSQGGTLNYDLSADGNTLYAFVNKDNPNGVTYDVNDDRLVFTFHFTNTETGAFEFKLFDQLDHDAPDSGLSDQNQDLENASGPDVWSINFGNLIKATDFDGDSVVLKNKLDIKITDDVPLLGSGTLEMLIDEDDIETSGGAAPNPGSLGTSPQDGDADGSFTNVEGDGTPGPAFASGSLATLIASGADENLTYGFVDQAAVRAYLESLGLQSQGRPLGYDLDTAGTIIGFVNAVGGAVPGQIYDVADDRLVFTLEVNSTTGEVEFRLFDQLDHDVPNDDAPTDNVNSGPGSDENTDLQQTPDGPGDINFIDFGSILQATDYDGDSVNFAGKFTVTITDDVPMLLSGHANVTVYENDINTPGAAPNPGSVGTSPPGAGPATTTGTLAGVVVANGADDGLTFGFVSEAQMRAYLENLGLTSKGGGLDYDFSADNLTIYGFVNANMPGEIYNSGQDRLVFTFQITDTATGEFAFQLYDQLDHDVPNDDAPTDNVGTGPGSDENTDLRQTPDSPGDINFIDFGALIRATDYDGDSILLANKVKVSIVDDVPQLKSGSADVSVDEDNLSNYDPNDNNNDGIQGSAGSSPGATTVAGSIGASVIATGADEPLVFSYLTAAQVRAHLEGLGLKSKGGFISYDLDTMNTNGEILGFVNSGGAAGGLDFNAPADRLVFKFDLNSDGTFTFTLYDQLDHDAPNDNTTDNVSDTPGTDENVDLQDSQAGDITYIDFGSVIKATDYDGDSVTLTNKVRVEVIDDIPSLKSGSATVTIYVDEDELSTGAGDLSDGITDNDGVFDEGTASVASILALANQGADEPLSLILNSIVSGNVKSGANDVFSKGQEVKFRYDSGTQTVIGYADANDDGLQNGGDRTVFRITISGGNVVFDLVDQLDHSDGTDPDSETMTIDIGAALRVSDYDNDSIPLTGRVNVVVENDIPGIVINPNAPQYTVTHDETGGLQNAGPNNPNVEDNNDGDVAGSTLVTFNGVPNTSIASLFNGIAGLFLDDPHVSNDAASTNSAIGFARSAGALFGVTVTPGADEPVSAVSWSLSVANNGPSGLATTEGKLIHMLQLNSTTAVGYYDNDGDNVVQLDGSDPIALAIRIDPVTGIVYVAQWVSLDHPVEAPGTGSPSYDEAVSFDAGIITIRAGVTDADEDFVGTPPVDLAGKIMFEDDGPAVNSVTPNVVYSGADLILNGSFESGHGLGGSDWEIFHSITNWTSDGTIPFEVQRNGAGGYNAQSGQAMIELDSDTEGNPGNPIPDINGTTNTNALIGQTVNGLTVGQTYEVSFWYMPRPSTEANGNAGMKVFFGGVEVLDIPSSPNPYTPGTWVNIKVIVTAQDTSEVLAFRGTGIENEHGALLDNVSMRAVQTHTLDDDDTALNGIGVPGGPGDDGDGVTASGSIGFTSGSDGLKSIEVAGIDGLQAVYVDGSGIGHIQDVQYTWTPDGSGGGTLTGYTTNLPQVFTLVVTSSGDYTFTLIAPLAHSAEDDGIEANGLETAWEDNIDLDFVFTVTDGDNDKATGTLSFNVDDDSPVASGYAFYSGTVTIDETAGNDAGTNDNDAAFAPFGAPIETASGFMAAVWNSSAYGADGKNAVAGTTSYDISVLPGGVDSGLTTSVADRKIFLFEELGLIVGREGNGDGTANAGGAVAFAITVDTGTGVLTVAQYLAIEHDDINDHDEANDNGTPAGDDAAVDENPDPVQQTILNGAIQATITVTDGDGDVSTSAPINIGGSITFRDDGPKILSVVGDGTPEQLQNGAFTDQPGSTAYSWGVIANTLPGWSIAASPVEPAGTVHFELVNSGYQGMVMPDGEMMLDMGASPGNIQISQQVTGLTEGEDYTISFYAGAPHPDTALLQVWWGTDLVATIPPGATMELYSYVVQAGATDPDNVLKFVEIGTGSDPIPDFATEGYHGTYLGLVSVKSGNLDDEDTQNPFADELQDGPGDDGFGVTATGKINFDAGADELASITAALASATSDDPDAISPLNAIYVDADNVGTPYVVAINWNAGEDATGALNAAYNKAGTLVGTIDVDGTDHVVFTLAIDNDGNYTYTQVMPLSHPNTDSDGNNDGDPETSWEDNIALAFNFTITDNDGDYATGTLDFNVDDDSPEFVFNSATSATGIVDGEVITLNAGVTEDLNIEFGADGMHAETGLAITGWPELDGVFAELSENGLELKAYIGTDNTGTPLYTLTLDPATGQYTFTQHANFPGGTGVLPEVDTTDSFNPVASRDYAGFTVYSAGLLNGSAQGIGVGNNGVQDTEHLYFVFDNPMDSVTLGVNAIGNINLMEIDWVAYSDAAGTNPVASGTTAQFDSDGNFIFPSGVPFVRLDLTGDLVGGGNVNASQFRIISVGGESAGTNPIDELSFEVTGMDGDGDAVTDVFTVEVIGSIPFGEERGSFGVVEEEHLQNYLQTATPNVEGSDGNEDEYEAASVPANQDDDDDEGTNDFDNTTDVTTGTLAVSGGNGGNEFSFVAGIHGTPVLFTETGTQIFSKVAPVHFFLESPTVLLGIAEHHGNPPTIDAFDRIVFRIDLNSTNGEFTFTLLDQLNHHPYDIPNAGSLGVDNDEGVMTIDLAGVFRVTDDANQTHDFQDVSVAVIDDIPVAYSATAAVDEDDLPTGNSDVAAGDDLPDSSALTVTGTLGKVGADELGVFNWNMSGAVQDTLGNDVYSGAQQLFWAVSPGGTLWATSDTSTLELAAANAAFEVQLDKQTGEYAFTLIKKVNHIDEGGPNGDLDGFEDNFLFNAQFTVTDRDGDVVPGVLRLDIDDDLPTVSPNTINVDEDDLTSPPAAYAGNSNQDSPGDDFADQATTATGVLGSVGADQPGHFEWTASGAVKDLNGNDVFSGTQQLFWVESPDGVLWATTNTSTLELAAANAVLVFTLDDVTGDYTFELRGRVNHPDTDGPSNNLPGYEDNIGINVAYSVTDSDGDESNSELLVNIDDDMPMFTLNTGSIEITMDESHSGGFGDGLGGDNGDDDDVLGQQRPDALLPLPQTPFGSTTIAGATVHANLFSAISYGADGPAANPTAYSLVLMNSVIELGIGLPVDSGLDVTLPAQLGNPDWAGVDPSIFLVKVSDTQINGVVGGTDIAFTITINAATGALTVEQYLSLDHKTDGNDHDRAVDTPDLFGSAVKAFVKLTATDGDNDSASQTSPVSLSVLVEDTGIVINSISGPSSATEGGATINGTWDIVVGNDGLAKVEVTVGAFTKLLTMSPGQSVVFDSDEGVTAGVLTVNSDFTWSFNPNGSTNGENVSFKIRIEDGDTDFDEDTRIIEVINNPTPEITVVNHAFVDEDGFGNNNDDAARAGEFAPPFGANQTIWNSTITVDYQTPAEAVGATIALVDNGSIDGQLFALNGNPINFDLVSGKLVGTAAGNANPIITIELTTTDASGTPNVVYGYMVTLHQPIKHDSVSNELPNTLTGVPFLVTDASGDEEDATFNVYIYDDIPVAEDDLATAELGETVGTPTYHLVYMLDVTGSLSDDDVEDALEAYRDLTQAYIDSGANVSVEVYRFRGDYDHVGTYSNYGLAGEDGDLADLLADLVFGSTFEPSAPGVGDGSGGTNYGAAAEGITEGLESIQGYTQPEDKTAVFFFTDGEPNGGPDTLGEINTTLTDTGFNTAVAALDADVHAFGVGGNVDGTLLEPFDNTPLSPIEIDDFADFGDIIVDAVPPQDPSEGNVLSNDINTAFGADGGYIKSILIDGVTYTFNGVGTITPTGVADSGHALDNNGGTFIEVTTALGGSFTFYFAQTLANAAGKYSYTAPTSIDPGDVGQESFGYTLVDNDGDETSASLTIDIPATVSVTGNTVSEGAGAETQVFTVNLSHAVGQDVTLLPSIGYPPSTASVVSDFGTDFEYSVDGGATWEDLSIAITIPAGETEALVRVTIPDDLAFEGDETFTFEVNVLTGPATGNPTGTATIEDNDNPPPEANNDIVLTNVVDGSPIVIPTNAMTSNDTDPNNDPLNTTVVPGSGVGGTIANGSAIFTPTVFGDVEIVTANFNSNDNDFDFEADFFVDGSNTVSGARNGTSGNLGTGGLHIDLGGGTGGSASNMNGAFVRPFTLEQAGTIVLTFKYRAQLSGGADDNEDVRVLASVNGAELGGGGIIDELEGESDSSSDAQDTGWLTFVSDPINLGAGTHELALGALMTSKSNNGNGGSNEFADVDFDDVVVTVDAFQSGSYQYTVNDGTSSDGPATVNITGVFDDTITGDGDDEILIGRNGHIVTADVRSGDTFENNNQFGFTFAAAKAGEHITQITITVPAGVIFDQSGSNSGPFLVGNESTVLSGDINTVTSGDVQTLTITFDAGAFTEGDVLRFRVDTDGSAVDSGNEFGSNSVPFTVTFSDGTTLSGNYQSGPSSTSIGILTDANDILIGNGGEDFLSGNGGNDTLTGGADADTFYFAHTGSAHQDTVTDYNFGQGDKLDLSALLDGVFDAGTDDINDFVQVLDTGANALVQVDLNGSTGGEDWVNVATLTGYGSTSNQVRVVLDDMELQVQVST
jgi:hypothetical protein